MSVEPSVRKVLQDVPTSNLQSLGQKRIFFGHQSVGANIISGLQALSQKGLVQLEVVEGRSSDAFESHPVLLHAKNGANRNPGSKIKDFASLMRTGLGARTDIAFFKFCYVDFESKAGLRETFDEYRSTMAALKAEFPHTTFVHVTLPLQTIQSGPKAILKILLGRKPANVEANIARHEFNQMLKQAYGGKEPVFDLADIESTYPDGRRAEFRDDGRSYPKLIDSYSSDGDHLNDDGARWVAAHLVRFLAMLPPKAPLN